MSPRRIPGTGTVEDLPSGRARYKLTLADGSRHVSTSCGSREEAERHLDAARALFAAGAAPVSRLTLGGYGSRWLDTRQTCNADTERGLWRHHVVGTTLAEVPVREVELRHIKRWAEGLQRHRALVQAPGGGRVPGEQSISVQTQKLCLALVRRVLSAAVLEGLIATNPGKGAGLAIDWPEADLDDEDWTFLTEPEIVKVVTCEAIPRAARLHYEWAIGAGPRQRESWGLRWRDVDLERQQGEIRRSGGRKTTKANKVRRFPLLPFAMEALALWREVAPSTHPDALVWPARRLVNGQPAMRPKGDDYGWADRKRGAQKMQPGHKTLAGIVRRVTYHDLRDTCAAGLLRGYSILGVSRRWSLEEVSDFLGHGSLAVTERYAHVVGGGLAASAAREVPRSPMGGAGEGAEVHGKSMDLSTFSSSPVGDRGAVRTRDLLFRKQDDVRAAQGVRGCHGLPMDFGEVAQRFLMDVACGEPVDPVGLAREAIMAGRLPALALRVLEGGPHQLGAALALAAALLDEAKAIKRQAG